MSPASGMEALTAWVGKRMVVIAKEPENRSCSNYGEGIMITVSHGWSISCRQCVKSLSKSNLPFWTRNGVDKG